MMRYVAQRAKLWGSTLAESALVDMVAEGVKDARTVVTQWPFTPDQAWHVEAFLGGSPGAAHLRHSNQVSLSSQCLVVWLPGQASS